MNSVFRTLQGNTRRGLRLIVEDENKAAVSLEEVTAAVLVVIGEGEVRTELALTKGTDTGELTYALSALEETALGNGKWKCRLNLSYADATSEQIPEVGFNYLVIDAPI